ncbi:MAG TPA: DUF512 domain-containing protein [Candidatus Caccomorpha excrementavium]|nr:DUF512 domain-containing protein [Candidatus Caccomorpha excrementavium]
MKRVPKKKGHEIKTVLPGSIASELELVPGDVLLSVNGKEIEDILDYHYLTNEEYLTVLVRKPDGEEWELEIEKEFEEDLGLEFTEELMDQYRSCRNQCIFCFIDQMPPGMRETLYFKDDDARLSFLQGNYITLTNMSDKQIDRIIFYKLSPINISIHTTNPELRCRMLNNRFAGTALEKIDRLCRAGITMNGQIVLCKGYNDGEELRRTLRDLEKYVPEMQSVSVVPVGLTKYRDGLVPLEPFGREEAGDVLALIGEYQEYYKSRYNTRLVFASDEWYLTAGEEIPEADFYENYPQIENGVGMVRSLLDEFTEAFSRAKPDSACRDVALATGRLMAPILRRLFEVLPDKFPNTRVTVYDIRNDFFGESITVAGLLTGRDIIAQLTGLPAAGRLLLPSALLRSGENVLLDDVTVSDIEKALQTTVRIVKSDGTDLLRAILGMDDNRES